MPWEIKEGPCKTTDGKDGRFSVIKKGSGESVGCHESRESADNQLKALYANAYMTQRNPANLLMYHSPTGDCLPLGTEKFANGQPRFFKKDVLRRGRFIKPDPRDPGDGGKHVVHEFSAARLDHICHVSNSFIKVGEQKPPIPDGHTFSAEKTLGFVHEYWREDDRLFMKCEPASEEIAVSFGTKIRAVSVYLEKYAFDSKGNVYQDCITHVAATPYPVVHGQDNFVPLDKGTPVIPVFQFSEEENQKMSLETVALALGLKKDASVDDVVKAGVGLTTKITNLEAQVGSLATQLSQISTDRQTAIVDLYKAEAIKLGKPLAKEQTDQIEKAAKFDVELAKSIGQGFINGVKLSLTDTGNVAAPPDVNAAVNSKKESLKNRAEMLSRDFEIIWAADGMSFDAKSRETAQVVHQN